MRESQGREIEGKRKLRWPKCKYTGNLGMRKSVSLNFSKEKKSINLNENSCL